MIKKKLVTPKFLTVELARSAVNTVLGGVMNSAFGREQLHRQACHIVVLVPGMEDAREADFPQWPNYPLTPVCLYEESFRRDAWQCEYDKIARCKALQLWTGRNDGRTDIMPHLLFPNDARFYGGVKREGIVVTCSGVQPWFDRTIAGMIADMIVGLAYNAWMTSDDNQATVVWLK